MWMVADENEVKSHDHRQHCWLADTADKQGCLIFKSTILNTHTHTCMHIHTFTYTHTCIYANTQSYMNACTHTHTHTPACIYLTNTHTHTPHMDTQPHTHTQMCAIPLVISGLHEWLSGFPPVTVDLLKFEVCQGWHLSSVSDDSYIGWCFMLIVP